MTLHASGPISLSQVQTEFGGSNPIGLSEYYNKAAGIPASGQISVSQFYGKSSMLYLTISGNTYNYNVRNALLATGWNGVTPGNITVTVNSGVIVGCSDFTSGAISGVGLPAGCNLFVVNNGYIVGTGGNAGWGNSNDGNYNFYNATAGASGGHAILLGCPTTITNNGYIFGGGGGGTGWDAGTYSTGVDGGGGAGDTRDSGHGASLTHGGGLDANWAFVPTTPLGQNGVTDSYYGVHRGGGGGGASGSGETAGNCVVKSGWALTVVSGSGNMFGPIS